MSREQDKRIKVAVRIRPPLERERYSSICARKTDDERVTITNEESTTGQVTQDFRFDYCFDEFDDQRTVYEEAVQEMIDHGLDGCNATIFTYGQTGSGKTFTILGDMGAAGELTTKSGMFLRVFDDLFNYRDRVKTHKHVVISLAAIEIYVDEVMDLLNNKAKVRLREVGDDTLMPGVCSFVVNSMADVMQYFRIANSFRSVTATKMNDESSRSHAIFFIDLFQQASSFAPRPPQQEELFREDGSPTTLPGLVRSRIALVDLAGSERTKRSGVEGQGMIEAQAINKSLSTLGTVINAMYESSKHIPFRESKLTRILRPSFTDKTSRLLLIGQMAPPADSFQESLGTLRFCDRVKSMKVATASPFIDPEEEHRYLRSLQANEELCADIRIAATLHFYRPQRPRIRARIPNPAALQVFIDSIAPRLRGEAAGREELELQSAINETQRQVFDEMRAELARREKLYAQLSSEMSAVDAELRAVKAALQKEAADHEAKSDERLTEAKKAKKKRLHSEEKIEKLRKAVAQADADMAQVSEELNAVLRKQRSNFDDDDDPDAEEWTQFELDWRICEANHDIVQTFFDLWTPLVKEQSEYVRVLKRNEREWDHIDHLRMMTSSAFNSSLIQDIIAFTIERAVYISEGVINPRDSYAWFDIQGCSKRLLPASAWCPPLDTTYHGPPIPRASDVEIHPTTTLSDDDEAATTPVSVISPAFSTASNPATSMPASPALVVAPPGQVKGADKAQQLQASQSNPSSPALLADVGGGSGSSGGGAASASSNAAAAGGAAPVRRKSSRANASTKKHDVAEADKHYLMSVYDSPTLVADVLKYLGSGTIMMKHGRSGKPHRRKFWVSNISLSRELIWVDPEKYPGSERNSIPIVDIAGVTLGQYSKVFKRHPAESEKEFYLSFTINLKDGSRTLDIVADTLVDFEAWVLGICHLAKVDPKWGKPLDIAKDEFLNSVSAKEKKVLEANHISPTTYMKLKQITSKHRDEVAMHMRLFGNNVEQVYDAMGGIHLPQVNHLGAVLMTKGELRYYCNEFNIDIFRVCKIWALFCDAQLVYDPGFTPATNFGVFTAQ